MVTIAGVTLPAALIVAAAVLELVCGLLLLVGQWARIAAAVVAAEMLGVVLLFNMRAVFLVIAVPNIPLAYSFEFHLALIVGLVCLALSGPGRWALADRLAGRAS